MRSAPRRVSPNLRPNLTPFPWNRKPYWKDWEYVPIDWAMDRIAERMKATRDATFTPTWTGKDRDGKSVTKTVNHCATVASLGGATMDNEWNYVQLKLWRALGLIW